MVSALLGAVALYQLGGGASARWVWAIAAAACIQLRLIANLLDGMVAVEHGRKQATGDLWNEVPDRFADVVLLLGAGYGIAALSSEGLLGAISPLLGWCAALLSMGTAYLRQLGGALGLAQDFRGPMAKQHRMFTLTLAALASPLEAGLGAPPGGALVVGLAVIAAGALVTSLRRLQSLAEALRRRADAS